MIDGSGLDNAGERLQSLLAAGGPVLWILLLLSVIALAVTLLKLWQFAHVESGARGALADALEHLRYGDRKRALTAVSAAPGPIADVVRVALSGLAAADPGDEPTVREETLRVAAARLEDMRSYLRVLEVIATLSPLLGLLGTVAGMIEAFRAMERAGSQVNPAILSGGIWEALLTTAAGLAIAIAVVVVLNWLERRVEKTRHRMEDAVTRVFTSRISRSEAA